MQKWCALLGMTWILASCGGSGIPASGNMASGGDPEEGGISEVPNPNAAMASQSGTPLSTLQRGHETYMLQCGQCHHYMLPQKVNTDKWQKTMPKMIRHAGLAPEDEKAVLSYVLAVKKVGSGS